MELAEMEVGRRKGGLDGGEHADIPKQSNYTFLLSAAAA